MKPPEILLASGVIALVGGVGAALATRAFVASTARPEAPALSAGHAHSPGTEPTAPSAALEELRRTNAALGDRLAQLEARLRAVEETRTAWAPERAQPSGEAARSREPSVSASEDPVESPRFVAAVEDALARVQEKEGAEREKRRKELQAQRIEDRVAELQTQLGLTNRQASDVRTALISEDDKREALFATLRDGQGDPRDARESFRTLRDDTLAELQRILTPDQYDSYGKLEEREFGRRGFGDAGGRPAR